MDTRDLIAKARVAADTGDSDTSIYLLALLAKANEHHDSHLSMDVNMRWHETVGALERSGLTLQSIVTRLEAAAKHCPKCGAPIHYEPFRECFVHSGSESFDHDPSEGET